MTATLDPAQGYFVLINTFDVDPERSEALLALLERATVETMSRLDGFVSANLHVSDDRTRVVNYAQWRDRAAFEAMREDTDAAAHMTEAAGLCTSFDPVFYELRASEGPATDAPAAPRTAA